MLLAMLTLTPAALRAQEAESLYTGWGAGFHIGVGGMIPTGSLGDDLKGCAVFTGGFDLEYQRARLKINVSYSQPSFKNENPYAVYDNQERDKQLNATANPTMLGGTFQLGYTVWRQGRVSVTPAVGVTISRLSWDINHIKYEADDEGKERPMIDNVTAAHENSFGWMASVDIDIKLHGKFVDLGGKSHYTSSVRITPFVTHAKFNNFIPAVKGCCVGATVSYAGLLSSINN